MKNRIKGYFLVHRPSLEVALVISFLLMLGAVCGYAIGNMETKRAVQSLQAMHIDEMNRMQTSHQYVVSHMTLRVEELVKQQKETSDELFAATKDIRSAASTANTASNRANQASKSAAAASKNAAQSNLRIREIEPDLPVSAKETEKTSPFADYIEY